MKMDTNLLDMQCLMNLKDQILANIFDIFQVTNFLDILNQNLNNNHILID